MNSYGVFSRGNETAEQADLAERVRDFMKAKHQQLFLDKYNRWDYKKMKMPKKESLSSEKEALFNLLEGS